MLGYLRSFMACIASLDLSYQRHNHPLPRRAKRNKQTNKKKNFRRR